jgi:hypothetical protein
MNERTLTLALHLPRMRAYKDECTHKISDQVADQGSHKLSDARSDQGSDQCSGFPSDGISHVFSH